MRSKISTNITFDKDMLLVTHNNTLCFSKYSRTIILMTVGEILGIAVTNIMNCGNSLHKLLFIITIWEVAKTLLTISKLFQLLHQRTFN